MLLVKLNGVDITEKVDYNTVKITEQMNNRSNTCSFTVSDIMVPEGAILEIWEGSELTQNESSGQPTIHVDDTFEYFIKYRVGDEIKIPAGSTSAITRVIDSIDHTLKTITFTANLPGALTKGDKIGRLIFAGVTLRNPDDEIGKS